MYESAHLSFYLLLESLFRTSLFLSLFAFYSSLRLCLYLLNTTMQTACHSLSLLNNLIEQKADGNELLLLLLRLNNRRCYCRSARDEQFDFILCGNAAQHPPHRTRIMKIENTHMRATSVCVYACVCLCVYVCVCVEYNKISVYICKLQRGNREDALAVARQTNCG